VCVSVTYIATWYGGDRDQVSRASFVTLIVSIKCRCCLARARNTPRCDGGRGKEGPAYGQSLRFFHDRKAKALTAADRTSEGELPSSCCHAAKLPMVDGWRRHVLLEQVRVDIAELRAMELS
jgi:hypothetical protein